jgi:transcriptional regulator with XRE-family HTH domain
MNPIVETFAPTTAPNAINTLPEIQQPTKLSPHTLSPSGLVKRAGDVRARSRLLAEDAADVHAQSIDLQLRAAKSQNTLRPHTELLAVLASLGFSWRDIARLAGVSVPALRKWRLGDSPTPTNLARLAEIVAVVDLIRESSPAIDVASWAEVPLLDSPFTPLDLLVDGPCRTVVELAALQIEPSDALDLCIPGWRDSVNTDYEVFTADDGENAIRLRPYN